MSCYLLVLSNMETKKNKSGKVKKTQLFTVTNDGQCIGRVYDQRRSGTKYIKNGCKFPLGLWKKGETRTFSVTDRGSRTVELKILSLSSKAFFHSILKKFSEEPKLFVVLCQVKSDFMKNSISWAFIFSK